MKRLNLIGKQFGRWCVIGPISKSLSSTKTGKIVTRLGWECRCSCGYLGWVTTQNLTRGQSNGCQNCATLPPGESAFNDLINRYRASAGKRGYAWELSSEHARRLFQSDCDYCGAIPAKTWAVHLKGGFRYNGIDRMDSFVGYVSSNCVACCSTCNYMKRGLSRTQFFSHIRQIVGRIRVEQL